MIRQIKIQRDKHNIISCTYSDYHNTICAKGTNLSNNNERPASPPYPRRQYNIRSRTNSLTYTLSFLTYFEVQYCTKHKTLRFACVPMSTPPIELCFVRPRCCACLLSRRLLDHLVLPYCTVLLGCPDVCSTTSGAATVQQSQGGLGQSALRKCEPVNDKGWARREIMHKSICINFVVGSTSYFLIDLSYPAKGTGGYVFSSPVQKRHMNGLLYVFSSCICLLPP